MCSTQLRKLLGPVSTPGWGGVKMKYSVVLPSPGHGAQSSPRLIHTGAGQSAGDLGSTESALGGRAPFGQGSGRGLCRGRTGAAFWDFSHFKDGYLVREALNHRTKRKEPRAGIGTWGALENAPTAWALLQLWAPWEKGLSFRTSSHRRELGMLSVTLF